MIDRDFGSFWLHTHSRVREWLRNVYYRASRLTRQVFSSFVPAIISKRDRNGVGSSDSREYPGNKGQSADTPSAISFEKYHKYHGVMDNAAVMVLLLVLLLAGAWRGQGRTVRRRIETVCGLGSMAILAPPAIEAERPTSTLSRRKQGFESPWARQINQ